MTNEAASTVRDSTRTAGAAHGGEYTHKEDKLKEAPKVMSGTKDSGTEPATGEGPAEAGLADQETGYHLADYPKK